jgi:hypothetical protein
MLSGHFIGPFFPGNWPKNNAPLDKFFKRRLIYLYLRKKKCRYS